MVYKAAKICLYDVGEWIHRTRSRGLEAPLRYHGRLSMG
jgi:hypothetical protein